MQKKRRTGQHAALGNASNYRHVFGAKTVDIDEKTGDPLA